MLKWCLPACVNDELRLVLQMQPTAEAPMFLLMHSWQLPQELLPLADYATRMRSRDSWAGTSTPNTSIIDQW